MSRRFTLIEIVISIVVLSILSAIVILGTLDLRKKAIANSINANVKQLQTASEVYFMEKEFYPVKNPDSLSLRSPQLVDIKHLEKEGYLKKDLDTSKVKNQYYWIDVFGKVWGSTIKDIESINVLNANEDQFMEFVVGEEATGYKLYEVNGYDKLAQKDTKEDLLANIDTGNLTKKKYTIVEETEVTGDGKKLLNFSIAGNSSDYLVSVVDKYGLETAPTGKFSSTKTPPYIFNKEGVYEFEIENTEDMYWVNFYYLADIPVGASIDFKFKVKDSNGEYGDWTEDYFELKHSKAITVQVDMKGDGNGNNPSLYDLRVVFKFLDLEDSSNPPAVFERAEVDPETCPKLDVKSTLGFNSWKAGKGTIVIPFTTSDFEEFKTVNAPKVEFSGFVRYDVLSVDYFISLDGEQFVEWTPESDSYGKCMVVVYELDVTSHPKEPKEPRICGAGGTTTTPYIKDKGFLTYRTILGENQKLSSIDVVKNDTLKGYDILSIQVEYSVDGKPYEKATSINDVPAGSCIIIVYEVEKINCKGCGTPPNPPQPEIKTCEELKNCPELCGKECIPVDPKLCVIDCDKTDFCELYECEDSCIGEECEDEICKPSERCGSQPPVDPDPDDPELNDPEWTTVETVRFFGHGSVGQLIRWYKAEHTEDVSDTANTRILYRYAKSGGYSWTKEYEDFETTGNARSVRASAYIQVRTSELKNILSENYPVVLSLKFYNERGYLDVSMIQPTLVITPEKDNNAYRDTFSTASKIKWDYVAADPRNKEIVDVEWNGDIREQYPAGTYEIKARVKNEVAIWSEWVTYSLDIVEEKPVAVIDYNVVGAGKGFITDKAKVSWTAGKSYDPDGDKLKKVEWSGDKSETYAVGDYKIKLRVQDEEGYWSDWTEYEFSVWNQGLEVSRVEGEDKRLVSWDGSNSKKIEDENYSGGAYAMLRGQSSGSSAHVELTTELNGFEVYFKNINSGSIYIDDVLYEKDITGENFSKRIVGLPQGVHTIRIKTFNRNSNNEIDYINIFSLNTKVKTSEVKPNVLSESNTVIRNAPSFSPILKEQYRLDYTIDNNAKQSISILNKFNKVVYQSNETNVYGGTRGVKSFTWNGLDSSGESLPTGTYTIVFDYLGVDNQTKSQFLHEVFLDKNTPVARIEGEDRILTKVETTGSDLLSSNYSNGKALKIIGAYAASPSSSEFTFEGTGFDIQFISAVNAQLKLDGVLLDTLNYSSPTKYSIRNLENTTHKVEIKSNSRSNPIVIDYYDIYNESDKTKVLSVKQETTSVSNLVIRESNELVNRLGNKVLTTYQINYDSEVEYLIKNSSGETVYIGREKVKGGTNGTQQFYWDGKTSNGSLLPTDIYSLTMSFVGVNGSTSQYKLEYDVKNIAPLARIEGEDTRFTKIDSYSSALSGEEYSNGKVAYMIGVSSGSPSSITLPFMGTGIDIKFIVANTVSIYVDDVLIDSVNYKTPTVYSIRNLSEGSHKIRIVGARKDNSSKVDYFDIYSDDDKVSILSDSQSIIDLDGKIIQSGNVVNVETGYKARIEYQLDYKAKVSHIVKNSSGKVVFIDENLTKLGGTYGYHTFDWDAKNNDGVTQSAGKYTATIKVISGSGKAIEKIYSLEVRNNNSIRRIEAESTEPVVSNAAIKTYAGYSGDKGRYVDGPYSGSPSSIKFTFTGTGAELKMEKNASSIIEVTTNGVTTTIIDKYTNANVNYVSISDLPEGTHTVTVRHTGGSLNAIVDYLDVY